MDNSEDIYQVKELHLQKRPLSYSSLKEFRKSPRHFIHHRTKKKKDTTAMIEGKATEMLILEPSRFSEKFMVANKPPNLNKKVDKEYWEGVKEQAAMNNQYLLTSEQSVRLTNAADEVKDNPEAWYFLRSLTKMQRKLFWKDIQTGLPVIGFSDFEAEDEGVDFVVDIKTAQSAKPDDFFKQFSRMGYDVQVGSYLNGYYRKFYKFPMFIFIVVETEAPHGVSVINIGKDDAEDFKAEFNGLLKAFKYCMDNNTFDRSYNFYLYGTRRYFQLELPKYHKLNFKNL